MSYRQYWIVNNLYAWAISQKLPVNNFEWVEDTSQFNEDLIKNYNEESDKGYFLKVDVEYTEKLHELHTGLPFLPERMKIKKIEKLLAYLHDKTGNVIHIRNLKQALNHEFVLKKIHRIIKFNQNTWLKPYILSWWIIQFLEKLWKMWENIEILNLPQQKEEGTIKYQNQIIVLRSFSQKNLFVIEMKKNRDTYK